MNDIVKPDCNYIGFKVFDRRPATKSPKRLLAGLNRDSAAREWSKRE
jgi:hypothetical protein